MDLFGDSKVIKNASSKDIENYILERLGDVFPAVAANPKVFVNEKQSPMFLFCFAVSNKSPKAQKLALKIAEHILGKKRLVWWHRNLSLWNENQCCTRLELNMATIR